MTDKKGNNTNLPDYQGALDVNQSMTSCLDKFSRTFEASARRWELVVYPSLLAFIILAAYGFFLIIRSQRM